MNLRYVGTRSANSGNIGSSNAYMEGTRVCDFRFG